MTDKTLQHFMEKSPAPGSGVSPPLALKIRLHADSPGGKILSYDGAAE
jgi:hypothetical protein